VIWEAESVFTLQIAFDISGCFQPKDKPWIKIDASTTDAIVETVKNVLQEH
jgi:hypothetical protein